MRRVVCTPAELILELFVMFLLMIPTVFLVRVGSRFEGPYTVFVKTLFVLGLSAPACLTLYSLAHNQLPDSIVVICLERLFWSSVILLIVGMSRLMARFDHAKRLTSYALLSETVTLCIAVAMLVYWPGTGRG
jgi:hypothetical protein